MFGFKRETQIEERVQPSRENTPHVAWRLWFLGLCGLAVLGGLGLRVYTLTVLKGPYFRELSENNYLSESPVSAPRGRIITADGTSIALNRILYKVEMGPYGLKSDDIRKSLDRLAELMNRPELRERADTVIKFRPSRDRERLTLASGLELDAVAPAIERAFELPGIVIETDYDRHYPFGPLFAHITGYSGAISEKQLKEYVDRGYLQQDSVGKIGAERQFEDSLRGHHGAQQVVRDAHGRPRSGHIIEPAQRGNDVVLTIDLRYQSLADALMADSKGTAIMMDPRDGAILALVSKLDYDPNYPTRGTGTGVTSSYNKVIRGHYAPASCFKLVTATAGLMNGRTPEETCFCGGRYILPGQKIHFWCDVRWGHGSLDLYEAIQKSCNVYFYRWSDQLGLDNMVKASQIYGFGAPSGIDLVPVGLETKGLLGKQGKRPVYRGSIIHMGIGQGALIGVTPIQLLCAYAQLGNGGIRMRPHIFKEERSPVGDVVRQYEPQVAGDWPLSEEHRQVLIEGFRRVTQEEGGTAYRKNFPKDWNTAGKTGSAEVHGQELTNGWFVAFAPIEKPEIAVIVLIEAEGHGASTAAPIVRELMGTYFMRRDATADKPIVISSAK